MSDITDKIIEASNMIKVILPPGTGYIIFAFDHGPIDKKQVEIASNTKLEDVIDLLERIVEQHREKPLIPDYGAEL